MHIVPIISVISNFNNSQVRYTVFIKFVGNECSNSYHVRSLYATFPLSSKLGGGGGITLKGPIKKVRP